MIDFARSRYTRNETPFTTTAENTNLQEMANFLVRPNNKGIVYKELRAKLMSLVINSADATHIKLTELQRKLLESRNLIGENDALKPGFLDAFKKALHSWNTKKPKSSHRSHRY